jgi:hypothetical protein
MNKTSANNKDDKNNSKNLEQLIQIQDQYLAEFTDKEKRYPFTPNQPCE